VEPVGGLLIRGASVSFAWRRGGRKGESPRRKRREGSSPGRWASSYVRGGGDAHRGGERIAGRNAGTRVQGPAAPPWGESTGMLAES
jgi:hypothetical protein